MRTQKVVTSCSKSASLTCTKGVPQGSVLGPVLYYLYVSGIPSLIDDRQMSIPSFADMFLYYSRPTASAACKEISTALVKLSTALHLKVLAVDKEKTVTMLIPPRNAPIGSFPQISCQGQALQMVSQTRLLGVAADNKLTWSSHTNKAIAKGSRKIGALRRSAHQLTPSSRRLFFLTVIQPDFEYAASAIVTSIPFSQKQRQRSLWRRAVRCAAGIGWQEDITSGLKDLRLTPSTNRWALKIAIDVRRCNFMTAPPELCKKQGLVDSLAKLTTLAYIMEYECTPRAILRLYNTA